MKVTLSKQHIHRIAPLLEPQTPLSEPRADGMTDLDPQISIAISLKRIADAVTALRQSPISNRAETFDMRGTYLDD